MSATTEEILASLEQKTWSSLAMDAVIASKAEKRAQKGQDLHMYTLDLSPRNADEPFNAQNMDAFIDTIHQQALLSDEPIRIQLAIRTSNVHWTAVDMEVSKEGVKSVQIDAAADPSSIVAGQLLDNLSQRFPDKTQSKHYFLRHGALPTDGLKQQMIQYDDASCSRFALDILFHLSNLDTINLMERRERELQGTSDAFRTPMGFPNQRFFKASNLPPEMAAIYRDTQSKETFQSLPPALHEQVINKKGETLARSEASHTENIEVKSQIKARNQAIHHKREGYIRDVASCLSQHADFPARVEQRDVLTAMRDGSFLSSRKYDEASIVSKLVSEAKKLEASRGTWGLLRMYNHLVNSYVLSQASDALAAGKPSEAIECLDRMRDLTAAHRRQITSIREKFSATEAVEHDESASKIKHI